MKTTQREFRQRLTQEEQLRIYTAAAALVDLRAWLDDPASVKLDEAVDTSQEEVIAVVQSFQSAGLLDHADRAAEILGADAAPVGGYALGQMVVLAMPFAARYPGEHEIIGFGPECIELSMGQFDPSYIKAV